MSEHKKKRKTNPKNRILGGIPTGGGGGGKGPLYRLLLLLKVRNEVLRSRPSVGGGTRTEPVSKELENHKGERRGKKKKKRGELKREKLESIYSGSASCRGRQSSNEKPGDVHSDLEG